jgi:hypothetical protein
MVMIMLRDLEHPAINEVNRKGYIGITNQPECAGIDYFGDEILNGDDVVIDGDEVILKDNLEKYLYEIYGMHFMSIE